MKLEIIVGQSSNSTRRRSEVRSKIRGVINTYPLALGREEDGTAISDLTYLLLD